VLDVSGVSASGGALRLVLDVSDVSGAGASGGFGSVYFSSSGPTSGGDMKRSKNRQRSPAKRARRPRSPVLG
jgi:hypothetical protein